MVNTRTFQVDKSTGSLAVTRAIESLPPDFNEQRLLIATDTTTVSYQQDGRHQVISVMDIDPSTLSSASKQGGCQSKPGRLSRLADQRSRTHQVVKTEWTLSRRVLSSSTTTLGVVNARHDGDINDQTTSSLHLQIQGLFM